MKIRCIAIDYQPEILHQIKSFASKFGGFNIIDTFTDAASGFRYLRENKVDLLFIDVRMPGISMVEMLHSLKIHPMIIFTSSHKKFAIEGFDLNAIDYLLKPLVFERFERMVHKVFKYLQIESNYKNQVNDNIFVRSNYEMIKIELGKVEYIESLKDYVKIHQTNEKPVLSLMTLKTILEQLPSNRFKRIHRSYIVPIEKVKSVGSRKIQLTNKVLPMSQAYSGFINEWQ